MSEDGPEEEPEAEAVAPDAVSAPGSAHGLPAAALLDAPEAPEEVPPEPSPPDPAA